MPHYYWPAYEHVHAENILRIQMSDTSELQTHVDQLQQQHYSMSKSMTGWGQLIMQTVPRITMNFVQHIYTAQQRSKVIQRQQTLIWTKRRDCIVPGAQEAEGESLKQTPNRRTVLKNEENQNV